MNLLFSAIGLIWLAYFAWASRRRIQDVAPSQDVLVSIIVPCRNEARDLPRLLASLRALSGVRTEIIVVDDDSQDETFAIASRTPGVRALRAPAKPVGWVGKTWACEVGSREAQGELLLFTDADTVHEPDSLARAVGFLQSCQAAMLSAPPFHECQKAWEKLLGPFCLLPLLATAYYAEPTPHRVFAIGQYLLFTRENYLALGAHEGVHGSLAEDIDLAIKTLRRPARYQVYSGAPLYRVQMYESWSAFWGGWRRLIRIGIKRASFTAVLSIVLMMQLFVFGLFTSRPGPWLLAGAGSLIFARVQKNHGRFAFLGAILAPINLILFLSLNLAAGVDVVRRKGIEWHGRSYANG